MALYRDAEIRKGGNRVRMNLMVDAYAYVRMVTGRAEWEGTLHPPNNIGLTLSESYTLVLPGFSPAKILITSEANAIDGTVSFKGVGEIRFMEPNDY